jgi:glycosyltransferase involved in cell wall biosynthesis
MVESWVVAQLGSRMHYAVPRILHADGVLAELCTDICAAKGWPRLLAAVPPRLRPAGVRRLLGRVPEGIPRRKIRAFSNFGWQYARRLSAVQTTAEQTAVYLWAGRRFGELILRQGLGDAGGVYTFNSAGLEVLRDARCRGLHAVMEQTIAPREVEHRLLSEEDQHHPGWEPGISVNGSVAEYCARERAEWNEAEQILCGSEFVREAIGACGGPVERCVVVPYGVDGRFAVPERRRAHGPLRVLTVGAVGLRKGSPYVLEAARRMGAGAEFRMVGPVGVSGTAVCELRRHVQLLGPVPRSEIMDQFAWADVFLLPSLCEGSATVTYEALRCGLPVICTPNTGSVVRDGVDGFLVPARDVQRIVDRLELLASHRTRLLEMAREAAARSREFTLGRYQDRLLMALKGSPDAAGRTVA